jgi:cell division protein FtsZ
VQAAELAISSPLLEASIDGAHGVLLSIQGGSDLGLFEINEAARLVQEAAHPEANIIFGAVIDDALGDEVRVTVIAAGFDGGSPQHKQDNRALGQVSGRAATPPRSGPAPAYGAPSPTYGTPAPPAAPRPEPVEVQNRPLEPAQAYQPQQPQQPQQGDVREPVQVPTVLDGDPIRTRPGHRGAFDESDDLDVPDFLK